MSSTHCLTKDRQAQDSAERQQRALKTNHHLNIHEVNKQHRSYDQGDASVPHQDISTISAASVKVPIDTLRMLPVPRW